MANSKGDETIRDPFGAMNSIPTLLDSIVDAPNVSIDEDLIEKLEWWRDLASDLKALDEKSTG